MLMEKQKFIFILGYILLGFLLIGCNTSNPVSKTGLQIYDMSTALGAVDNNNIDKQKLSYSVTVTNEENREIYVKSIKPILGNGISSKVITEDLTVMVEKSIPANKSLTINGEIIINTEGLSKVQILDLEPFITDFKIVFEQIIELKSKK